MRFIIYNLTRLKIYKKIKSIQKVNGYHKTSFDKHIQFAIEHLFGSDNTEQLVAKYEIYWDVFKYHFSKYIFFIQENHIKPDLELDQLFAKWSDLKLIYRILQQMSTTDKSIGQVI